MLNKSTILTYPFLLLLSTGKRSFENLGRFIQLSGRAVASMLPSENISFGIAHNICRSIFYGKKKLYLIVDDTLIKKIYATNMRGAGMFFDTKIGRCINAFRLVTAMLSDGRYSIPIDCAYLFAKELIDLCSERFKSKDDIVKAFVIVAQQLFPHATIVVVADGLYSSIEFLKWCVENKVSAEFRMHSNRVVTYKSIRKPVRELAKLPGVRLTGRQTARTISVDWHGLNLELTIVKRIDKHDQESIVFQIATHKAEPREHVKTYRIRWGTEKLYRTSKQSLGLQDCFSKDLAVQHKHVAATLLAYAFAELERKRLRLDTPEDSIRASKEKFDPSHFAQLIDQYESFTYFDA